MWNATPRFAPQVPVNLDTSAKQIRGEAARARRLATTLTSDRDIDALLEMAREFEERADRLEAEPAPGGDV